MNKCPQFRSIERLLPDDLEESKQQTRSERRVWLDWLFILAASQSDTDNSATTVDKNALRLHCCCVIVQITPVTGSTTASVKDVGGSGSRKKVCICNAAPCRIEALQQQSSYRPNALLRKQQHGSLDRLLPLEKAAPEDKSTMKMQQISEQNYSEYSKQAFRHDAFISGAKDFCANFHHFGLDFGCIYVKPFERHSSSLMNHVKPRAFLGMEIWKRFEDAQR